MKRFLLFLAAALMVSTVLAGFKYEGEWGKYGTGDGEFNYPADVAVAPNGNVYVADYGGNNRIQYFTPDGSFLGKWPLSYAFSVAVAPSGNVYAGGCDGDNTYVYYFTPNGSFLRAWRTLGHQPAHLNRGDVAPNGDIYTAETPHSGSGQGLVVRYSATGSLLGSWAFCEVAEAGGLAVSPSFNVYVVEAGVKIKRYTSNGSLLGSWGRYGTGDGEFEFVWGLDVGPDGRVFAVDYYQARVQYFTAEGSFIGKFGTLGSGPGEFRTPMAVAVSPDGKRVYVADRDNYRIQYFYEDNPAVSPTSLGKVKALFR